MSAEVAVYVQSAYAKPAYTVESYNVRAWPGLEMICAFFGCVRAGLIPVPVYPPSSRGFQRAFVKPLISGRVPQKTRQDETVRLGLSHCDRGVDGEESLLGHLLILA